MTYLHSVPTGEASDGNQPFDVAFRLVDRLAEALPEQFADPAANPATFTSSHATIISQLQVAKRAHDAGRLDLDNPTVIDLYNAEKQLYTRRAGAQELNRVFSRVYREATIPSEPEHGAIDDIMSLIPELIDRSWESSVYHSDIDFVHGLTPGLLGVIFDPAVPPYEGREAAAATGLQYRLVPAGDIFINFLPADLMPRERVNGPPRWPMGPRIEMLIGAGPVKPGSAA